MLGILIELELRPHGVDLLYDRVSPYLAHGIAKILIDLVHASVVHVQFLDILDQLLRLQRKLADIPFLSFLDERQDRLDQVGSYQVAVLKQVILREPITVGTSHLPAQRGLAALPRSKKS
eukprot:CAMPEP_0167783574 /NCGR_PEP_ID=MMETSP0111_2-20121227/7146_1 /TAXON_ID=91324 /ORGANISM="Lotharella globosa, Strain CCCM811" /LENGTH=119 /DNA_ID=CAMNT_0007674527 /DNA_START=703 /DNA_END=1062 /DNA_ORIENTATION=-